MSKQLTVESGRFIPPLDNHAAPVMYVAAGHVVVSGKDKSLCMESGGLFDAMTHFGAALTIDCGLRVLSNATNRNGIYGFVPVRDATREAPEGFGLLQARYAPWERPSLALIATSAQGLASYLKQEGGFNVRLEFPGLPEIPSQEVLDILSKTLGPYRNRLTLVKRVPLTREELLELWAKNAALRYAPQVRSMVRDGLLARPAKESANAGT